MKILFLSDNFFPEVNAPANRTYEHCKEWTKQGHEVTVITCVPNFPKGEIFGGYKNKLRQTEWIDGIKVVRVWSYIAANRGKVRRILDYTSFAVMSFLMGLFYKTDIIVATSPQFFTAISGRMLSLFKRKPWIMEVRDIWPESIIAVGAMKKSKTILMLEKLEKHLYQSATGIIVVTSSFKDHIISKGIAADKIEIVQNGVAIDLFTPKNKNESLIDKHQLTGKFVVGYLGTHGMAHKLDFVLTTAKKLESDDIAFLFLGDGAEKLRLLQLQKELNCSNVIMLPSVSKDRIVDYISIIDVALVNLKKSETFKNVIPSKIFENAAMQKPILLGVEGEAKSLIEKYKAGICFEPEHTQDFINAIFYLKNDTEFYSLCQQGCKKLALDFERKSLALKMLVYLERWK
ncbi:MAG: glycosyltransferase family 4 protein [Chitinophagales bacterium]|nr:glycosyltransferase family 4 protein [Chitinophagales bacterium]